MQRLADVSRPITAPSSLTLKTAPFNRPEMAASLGCIGREVRFSHRRVYQNHCRLPILDCRLEPAAKVSRYITASNQLSLAPLKLIKLQVRKGGSPPLRS